MSNSDNAQLAELRTLASQCRDGRSAKFYNEAVNALAMGAYKASIITAWSTLVYDLLFKIQELAEIDEQAAAKQIIEEFQANIQARDFRKAWDLETGLLMKARDLFEMISPIEFDQLQRLLEDRNRSAHPAFHSLGEPFEPAPEICVYHLRNIAVSVLTRPPVQGTAALNRVWEKISSTIFPIDFQQAEAVLRAGPLGRAKKALLRQFFIGLTKDCLGGERPENERARQFSALVAFERIYPDETTDFIDSEFEKIIQAKVGTRLHALLAYLGHLPKAYQALEPSTKLSLDAYIDSLESSLHVPLLIGGLGIYQLLNRIKSKLLLLQPKDLAYLVTSTSRHRSVLIDIAIEKFSMSPGWKESGQLASTLITPFADEMTVFQVGLVIDAFGTNAEISGANFSMPNFYRTFLIQTQGYCQSLEQHWQKLYEIVSAKTLEYEYWKDLIIVLDEVFAF